MEDLESARHAHQNTDNEDRHQPPHHWQRLNSGIRPTILVFSPQWFTLTMGSGITSFLLYKFPYPSSWLYWLSVTVFALHALLVLLFTLLSLTRLILYPSLIIATLHHSVERCYLGAFPASLLSLANMISLVCAPSWGSWAAETAWVLWIVASVIALLVAGYVPWSLVHYHSAPRCHRQQQQQQQQQQRQKSLSTKHCDEKNNTRGNDDEEQLQQQRQPLEALKQISPILLLAPISVIVASTTAATVAGNLSSRQRAGATALTGYILLGLGLSTALFIMVLYFVRLLIYGLPGRETVLSGFIPIGPLNMGAAACLMLGAVAKNIFPTAGSAEVEEDRFHSGAGEVLHAVGLLIGVALWAFGLLWLWFAVGGVWACTLEGWWARRSWRIMTDRTVNHNPDDTHDHQEASGESAAQGELGIDVGIPFNMSWWSLVFPLGTMALSSGQIAQELPSTVFRVFAAGLSVLVALLFLLVAVLTVLDLLTNQGRKVLKSLAVERSERRRSRRSQEDGSSEHHDADGSVVAAAGGGGGGGCGANAEQDGETDESTLKGVDSAEEGRERRRRTKRSSKSSESSLRGAKEFTRPRGDVMNLSIK